MGDNAEVMAAIDRLPGVTYSALTPNLKGCRTIAILHVTYDVSETARYSKCV